MQKFELYEPQGVKIAEKIIKILILGLAIPAFLTSPFALQIVLKGTLAYAFRKRDFNREVKRLQKKGYVALTKTPEGWLVRLLNKGKSWQDKIQGREKFNSLKLTARKPWDKKWRFFIFDIPEKQRGARNALRDKLKELGLYNMQRSVFAYPYDCREELAFISDYYRLTRYTTYVEADHTDIDRELRKHFKVH